MKKPFCKSVLILITTILLSNCGKHQSMMIHSNDKISLSMDDVENVPEWLKLNVDEVFVSDSLNVWIPTGNFQSSSLIRVPRFPRKFSKVELENNPALKSFQINNIHKGNVLELSAIKNEQVSAQIAFGSKKDISSFKVALDNLKSKDGSIISSEDIEIRYVKYVPVQRARSEYVWSPKLEDIVGEGVSGSMDPNVVGDPLVEQESVNIPAYRAQPVWFTIKVPGNTSPGTYYGEIIVTGNEFKRKTYKLQLDILSQQIPNSVDYKFHLDLWVNPSVIADFYKLEHWSEAHWAMIEKYLKEYASRGGKNITTTITHEPWHKPWISNTTRSQIAFGYKSMIDWYKNLDGNWEFDFTVFDKYVTLATDLGIKGAINAFSMTPFHTNQKIHYIDKLDGATKILEVGIEDKLYNEIWSIFLRKFKNHLIEKGLFQRVYLAFDERPESEMKIIHEIIESSAPEFLDKTVISGHPEVGGNSDEFSISYMFFPDQPLEEKATVPVLPTIEERKKQGKKTSFYLCAEPAHPNTLTYSPAIEGRMVPWLALKYNADGYLRWAFNNWTEDPFKKPVFIHAQGDDYQIYPGKEGPISSIRWELLKEGIEDYELFTLLKNRGLLSEETQEKAITLATKSQDGRLKNTSDFIRVRELLLEVSK